MLVIYFFVLTSTLSLLFFKNQHVTVCSSAKVLFFQLQVREKNHIQMLICRQVLQTLGEGGTLGIFG